jgi:hypothetical protein
MFTLTPGRPGLNEITLMYFPAGQLVQVAEVVSLTLIYLDHGGVSFVLPPTQSHPGHAYLLDDHIRHAGKWRVEALLHREGGAGLTVGFDLVIP